MKTQLNRTQIILAFIFIGLFLIILFLPKNREVVPSVISTIPSNTDQEVMLDSHIDITFNETISEKSKSSINISIKPETGFDSTWLTNNLKIIPKTALIPNSTYSVNVSSKEKELYKFTFNTQVFSPEQIKEYGHIQSQDDFDYGEALKKVVNKYPFYPNLPIKTKNYVIYYDFDQDKFAITFLVDNLDQQTKNESITEAIEHIKKIGGKEPINFYTQP
jgi:hypothetical protein